MRSFRSKPIGWRNESYRHYLAAKGISTNKYYSVRRFKRSLDEIALRRAMLDEASPDQRVRIEAEIAALERSLPADFVERQEPAVALPKRVLSPEELLRVQAARSSGTSAEDYAKLRDLVSDLRDKEAREVGQLESFRLVREQLASKLEPSVDDEVFLLMRKHGGDVAKVRSELSERGLLSDKISGDLSAYETASVVSNLLSDRNADPASVRAILSNEGRLSPEIDSLLKQYESLLDTSGDPGEIRKELSGTRAGLKRVDSQVKMIEGALPRMMSPAFLTDEQLVGRLPISSDERQNVLASLSGVRAERRRLQRELDALDPNSQSAKDARDALRAFEEQNFEFGRPKIRADVESQIKDIDKGLIVSTGILGTTLPDTPWISPRFRKPEVLALRGRSKALAELESAEDVLRRRQARRELQNPVMDISSLPGSGLSRIAVSDVVARKGAEDEFRRSLSAGERAVRARDQDESKQVSGILRKISRGEDIDADVQAMVSQQERSRKDQSDIIRGIVGDEKVVQLEVLPKGFVKRRGGDDLDDIPAYEDVVGGSRPSGDD
jgi:hypothetical protein